MWGFCWKNEIEGTKNTLGIFSLVRRLLPAASKNHQRANRAKSRDSRSCAIEGMHAYFGRWISYVLPALLVSLLSTSQGLYTFSMR